MSIQDGVKQVYEEFGPLPYLHLYLLYWQRVDGIEIPSEIADRILAGATAPGSIERAYRHLLHEAA